MGWLSALWVYLAHGDLLTFSRWLKVPGLVGEVCSIWLLWRFASPYSAAIYALSPVAILVSAFHGNTDALCAALILAGAMAGDRQRWFTCGVLFAAATNVKLIPLVLLPVLVLIPPPRALSRLIGGLALGIIPFIPPALSAAAAMRKNMLDYNGAPNSWGLMAFLSAAHDMPRLGAFQLIQAWYAANGRLVLLGAIAGVAIWSRLRNRTGFSLTICLAICVWLILTPGFGIQYMIYAAPLLCLVHRGFAIAWSCAGGATLAIDYWIGIENLTPARTSWVPPLAVAGPALLFGVLAWAVLVLFVVTDISRRNLPDRPYTN